MTLSQFIRSIPQHVQMIAELFVLWKLRIMKLSLRQGLLKEVTDGIAFTALVLDIIKGALSFKGFLTQSKRRISSVIFAFSEDPPPNPLSMKLAVTSSHDFCFFASPQVLTEVHMGGISCSCT